MMRRGSRDALEILRDMELPRGDFAIFGSGPLLVRNIIGDSGDLDVVCRGRIWDRVRAEGKLRYLEKYDVTVAEFLDGRLTFGTQWGIGDFSVDQLIDTAEYIDGLPFVRLEFVVAYKRIANRPKDIAHLQALQESLAPVK